MGEGRWWWGLVWSLEGEKQSKACRPFECLVPGSQDDREEGVGRKKLVWQTC